MVAATAPAIDVDITLRSIARLPRALNHVETLLKILPMDREVGLDYLSQLEADHWLVSFTDDRQVLRVILSSAAAERIDVELEPLDATDVFKQRWRTRGRADHHRADGPSPLAPGRLSRRERRAKIQANGAPQC